MTVPGTFIASGFQSSNDNNHNNTLPKHGRHEKTNALTTPASPTEPSTLQQQKSNNDYDNNNNSNNNNKNEDDDNNNNNNSDRVKTKSTTTR